MKLVRFGDRGSEKPGLIDAQGAVRDLSGVVPDIDGRTLSAAALARLREIDHATLPAAPEGVRLGACVGNVPNVVCIGLNYSDHAAETNTPIPSQPVVFNKHTGAVAGPDDALILAPGSAKLDWEVELAVVIGTPAWNVSEEDALDHVAGYCLCNDVSERAWQLEYEGQWTKGKSYYGYAPLGPWLVTTDEVPDPQNVDLWLEVNGVRRQTGSTRTQIFGVAHVVSYLSRFMALQAGDVIATGTPPGVGLGHKPPLFLKAGDRVVLG
ncbi:MAG: fumarylacetoacetate hydrolase family protein, partial [Variovorax sp.]